MRYTLERRSSSFAFWSTDLTFTVPIAICSTASMTLLAKTLPLRPHPPAWFTHLLSPCASLCPLLYQWFLSSFYLFSSPDDRTHGLLLARQVLCSWPTPLVVSYGNFYVFFVLTFAFQF